MTVGGHKVITEKLADSIITLQEDNLEFKVYTKSLEGQITNLKEKLKVAYQANDNLRAEIDEYERTISNKELERREQS